MSLPMQHIIQHLFNTASLSDVPREQLEALVEEHPSFGVARYLLSRKLQAEADEHFSEETLKTNLYFSNPYWLQWLLKNNGEEGAAPEERVRSRDGGADTPPEEGLADGATDAWTSPVEEAAAPEEPIPEPEVHERLYGSAEEARAAAIEEIHVHEDAVEHVVEDRTGTDEHVTESEAEEALEGSEPAADISTGWLQTELEEVREADAPTEEVQESDAPSAADQLLQSIAALRLSHQQAAEENAPAVPEEPAPVLSIAGLALEQADDHTLDNNNIENNDLEGSDGTPPLPEDSEESTAAPAVEVQGMPEGLAGEAGRRAEAEEAGSHLAGQTVGSETEQGERSGTGFASGHGVLTPIVEPVVAFEPFHTIDYFASQGIKLTLDENPSDKLGKQLKSFTDWLKVMRRLPQQNTAIVPDIAAEHQVRASAAHSIEGKEVVTETMAEVLAKQGMREKAMDVYRKLSLLDPDKSAYFAHKIEELKID